MLWISEYSWAKIIKPKGDGFWTTET